ncbi:MAG: hypothetical protein LBF78_07760 [Treponema sp.]|nr:hypothetical protein [Treponema sp.]
MDENFSQWFALSVKWLKLRWLDFKIAAFNPNAGGVSDDSPLDMPLAGLLEKPQCLEIVECYIPGITAQVKENPSLGFLTLRKIAFYTQFNSEGPGIADKLSEMEKMLRAVLVSE